MHIGHFDQYYCLSAALGRQFHYAELGNQSGTFEPQQVRGKGPVPIGFLQNLVQNRPFKGVHELGKV